jgi:hypothetical protein
MTVRWCVRGWKKRERAIIIPPLKVGEAGMVWILLLEGRWKMSTLGLLDCGKRGGKGARREREERGE